MVVRVERIAKIPIRCEAILDPAYLVVMLDLACLVAQVSFHDSEADQFRILRLTV